MTASVSASILGSIKRRAICVLDAEMDLSYAREKRRAIESLCERIEYDHQLRMHVDKLVEDQQRCAWRLQDAKDQLEEHETVKKQREDELRWTPFHDGINEYGHFTGSDELYVTAVIRHLSDYSDYEWPSTEGEVFTVYAGNHAGDSLQFKHSFGTVLVANNLSTGSTCAVQRELCVPPFSLPPGALYDTEYPASVKLHKTELTPFEAIFGPDSAPKSFAYAAFSPKRAAHAGTSPKSPAYAGTSPKSPAYAGTSPKSPAYAGC
jgi:hypothetical protein